LAGSAAGSDFRQTEPPAANGSAGGVLKALPVESCFNCEETMNAKSLFTSRTIIGIVLTLVATVLGKWGYKIDASLQNDTIDLILTLIQTVIGPGIAIYGRWKASKRLAVSGGDITAGSLVLLLMLGLVSGCQAQHVEAEKSTAAAQLSLMTYQSNVQKLVEAFIKAYGDEARAKADQLYADAVAAETGSDGKANVANIQALQAVRLKHYQQIEATCSTMRQKFIDASRDAANALAVMDQLRQYWQQTTSASEVAQQSSAAAISLLQTYIDSKAKK
jgi:hypothetical protein